MPSYPVKQPDGRYAVFSTVVDDFIEVDCSAEEIEEIWCGEAVELAKHNAAKLIERADKLGVDRYRECVAIIRRVHQERNC